MFLCMSMYIVWRPENKLGCHVCICVYMYACLYVHARECVWGTRGVCSMSVHMCVPMSTCVHSKHGQIHVFVCEHVH